MVRPRESLQAAEYVHKVGPEAFVGASPFVGASFVFGAGATKKGPVVDSNHKNQPNVGKYTIHGSYGLYWLFNKDPCVMV